MQFCHWKLNQEASFEISKILINICQSWCWLKCWKVSFKLGFSCSFFLDTNVCKTNIQIYNTCWCKLFPHLQPSLSYKNFYCSREKKENFLCFTFRLLHTMPDWRIKTETIQAFVISSNLFSDFIVSFAICTSFFFLLIRMLEITRSGSLGNCFLFFFFFFIAIV